MTRRLSRAGPLLLAACACSSAPSPAPATAETEPLVWPAAPDPPRVRHRACFPDAAAARPRSFWTRTWDFILGRDSQPTEPLLLARPFGVAVDRSGFVVADPDARRVLRVDWQRMAWEPVECKGRPWAVPIAVAVDDAAVWVVDAGKGVVVRVDASGKCAAIGEGRLVRPSGVALSEDLIWVVDPPAHVIVALAPDGTEKRRLGSHGEEKGQLNFPTGIAVAPDGTLLVVDALNFRVSRFTPEGRYVDSFGGPGDAGGAFGRPKAVAVDGDGRIYVSDVYRDLVLVFSPDGAFELSFGGSGREAGRMAMPAGIAIDRDTLYVADSYGHRVQVYQILGGAP